MGYYLSRGINRMTDYDLPESIRTNNPKELIAYNIAFGIKEKILPEGFNLSTEGYIILENVIRHIWDKGDTDLLAQVITSFCAGFALGRAQIGLRKK
jgi:hypothetical protein